MSIVRVTPPDCHFNGLEAAAMGLAILPDRTREQRLEAALLEYVERYGLTDRARAVLSEPKRDATGDAPPNLPPP